MFAAKDAENAVNALVETGHRASIIGKLDRQFAGITLVMVGNEHGSSYYPHIEIFPLLIFINLTPLLMCARQLNLPMIIYRGRQSASSE